MARGGGAGTEQAGRGRERESGSGRGLASRFPTVAELLCLYGSTSELALLSGS